MSAAGNRSVETDGFSLAYDRPGPDDAAAGAGPAVVALHGWPGDRHDYRTVVPMLSDHHDVVVPDLRGFGDSDRRSAPADQAYSADAQAGAIAALMDELGISGAVVVAYDIGSRIAQVVARTRPDLVAGLVITPPVPGVGARVLSAEVVPELWHQHFARAGLASTLDGRREAVAEFLCWIWRRWAGPGFRPDLAEVDRLVDAYSRRGALISSMRWYQAGPGYVAAALAAESGPRPEPLDVPTELLWPEHDPLFPFAWSDAVPEHFTNARVQRLDGVGHFVPLEAPEQVRAAVERVVRRLTADG